MFRQEYDHIPTILDLLSGFPTERADDLPEPRVITRQEMIYDLSSVERVISGMVVVNVGLIDYSLRIDTHGLLEPTLVGILRVGSGAGGRRRVNAGRYSIPPSGPIIPETAVPDQVFDLDDTRTFFESHRFRQIPETPRQTADLGRNLRWLTEFLISYYPPYSPRGTTS